MSQNEIKLGDLVKDKITGFTGIAVCKSQWLTGCARYTVQPREVKDGKIVDAASFDETQLEVIEPTAYSETAPQEKIGGPRPEPSRH